MCQIFNLFHALCFVSWEYILLSLFYFIFFQEALTLLYIMAISSFFIYIIQVFLSYFSNIEHYQMIFYFFAPCIYILFFILSFCLYFFFCIFRSRKIKFSSFEANYYSFQSFGQKLKKKHYLIQGDVNLTRPLLTFFSRHFFIKKPILGVKG